METAERLISRLVEFARGTPHRTFVVYPLVALLVKVIGSQGRPRLRWRFAPLLAWGYLQYRWCGEYRRDQGGGGRGMETLPDNIVTTGPHGYIRNPMYLGHIIFLLGLGLFARSKLVLLFGLGVAWWFNRRVEADERRLEELWGEAYRTYKAEVPRWLPRLPF